MGAIRSSPTEQGSSDEQLMQRLAGGDDEALAALYRRYAGRIRGFAAHALDRSVAEDIVQEVFFAVWRHAGTYVPTRGPVRPWLFQIAHHRILNEIRARRHRPTEESDPTRADLSALPSPAPEPDEAAWREEQRTDVHSAVEDLPAGQREALNLAFFGGMSHQQVAAKLDLPLGTTKTRIRAGLRRLRVALAPLVAAMVLGIVGASIPLGLLHERDQAARKISDQALTLLTSSDTAVIRLVAAPGESSAAHGTYRGGPGSEIAVIGLSHLPSIAPDETYRVWIRHDGAWRSLGSVRPDSSGHAHLVTRDSSLRHFPAAVEVTRELDAVNAVPTGPAVVVSAGTGR